MKSFFVQFLERTLLCAALLGTTAWAFGDDNLNPPPQQVSQTIENAKRMGHSNFRWFGLRVYEAQLWSGTNKEKFNYKRDASWLELKYARDFKGQDIAQRSIDEMKSIGAGTPEQHQTWLLTLKEIFPDIKKGDTLSALFDPGKGIQFFLNAQPLARMDNPALAQAFMGIWLDPKTSAPDMRLELIGLKH